MTLTDRYKALDRKFTENKFLVLGVFLIIGGCLFLVLPVYFNAKPDFSNLKVISGYLSGPPWSGTTHPREAVHGWIVLAGKRYQINDVCFLPHSHCRLPVNIRNLKAGDHVTIWVSTKYLDWDKPPSENSCGRIWQIQKDQSVLLSYKELVLANHNENRRGDDMGEIIIAIGLFLMLIHPVHKAGKFGRNV